MTAKETEIWYCVQVMRKWSSLSVLGIPLDMNAVAPGCIGFMPIFSDKESAQRWRDEQEHSKAAIAQIMRDE